ncbi:MAG: RtcB family protein [Dehalococcoidia bacterium]
MAKNWKQILKRIDGLRWDLSPDYKKGMRVPGRIYASEEMLDAMAEDEAIEQVANVAFLPGIVGRSLAMPDIHWGYGFPIGGVAATRLDDGVVSPGGVGYDINCGVRVVRTNLREEEVSEHVPALINQMFRDVPAGLGLSGLLKVSMQEIDKVMAQGARWAVEKGYGWPQDLEAIESGGSLPGADPTKISRRARERGVPQLGTLGSGNHFLELQVVDEIFDKEAGQVMGIDEVGQIMVFIHTGSRGLGHQTCQDYLDKMEAAAARHGIQFPEKGGLTAVEGKVKVFLPDKQLACAPIASREGQDYLGAMFAAANFAFANRQMITHWVREAFGKVLGRKPEELGMNVIYDVAHNIAKIERHHLDGREMTLCVHRKGATRAFPPGHPDVPAKYQAIGQPVLVPGDMGRYSFICVGAERAMAETWGSTCHGAGRMLSRHAAKRELRGVNIAARLADKGILVRAQNKAALAEEASEAYKDVAEVVDVLHDAGIASKVVRLRPIGVVKG